MASAIRQMTSVGGDIRKIARLLQKKAPPGHMLAYINQEEADLLKARGGSGKPHEDTGIPSFEEEYTEFDTPMPVQQEAAPVPQGTEMDFAGPATPPSLDEKYQQAFTNRMQRGAYMPYGSFPPEAVKQPSLDERYQQAFANRMQKGSYMPYGSFSAPVSTATEVPMTDASSGYYRPYYAEPVAAAAAAPVSAEEAAPFVAAAPVSAEGGVSFRDALATPRETGARESFDTSIIAPGGSEAPTTKIDKGVGDEIKDWWKGLSKDTKARLGIGGIEAIIGAYQTSQAMEQARKYREDIAKTAQPYQQQGKELIEKARSGELSPVAQQTLQAAQAQAAQGAQARGGVGAQQTQAQVEALRQQLLQQQYDYGLKVLGIGDQIAVGAIKAGMQADSYVNQLASNYTMNIARTVAGTPSYNIIT